MDAQEQRYFQLQAGTYRKEKGSLTWQLFQLMSKSGAYDEKAIRESICGENPTRQFHVLKNHLFHQVLEALLQFRKEGSISDRITLLVQKSRLLQEKKMYPEANRFLKRAAKLALQHDQFEQVLEIYKHWKRLYAWILEVDKRAEHIANFWKKEQDALAMLTNLRTLEWLSMRVFDRYYRHHYATNAAEIQAYERLMDHPLLQQESAALSFSAKVIFLNTHGLYEDAIGRKENCIRFRQRLVELYQAHPDRLKEHFSQYLASFNNYVLALIHEARLTEATLALDTLEQLPNRLRRKIKTAEQLMWFRAYFSLRLEVSIRQGDFRGALDLIPPVQQHFTAMGNDLNPAFRFPFHYFFAYTYFALGRFDQALDQLEPLLYQVELSFKQELFRFARLLQLILYWEKEEMAHLSSLIRSTRRYLRRLGGTYPLEELLLRFLGKAPFVDPKAAFRQLNIDLQAVDPPILSPHIIHHFDLRAWIGSHVEGRPFADIYQEIRH